jgi:hypothetical protein
MLKAFPKAASSTSKHDIPTPAKQKGDKSNNGISREKQKKQGKKNY